MNELAAFFSQDSFPKIYKGYRLSIYDVKVESESKKGTEVRFSVANTGRLPLIFSEKSPAPLELVVELDTPSLPPRLRGREELLVLEFLNKKVNLAPGKFKSDFVVKVPFEKKGRPQKKPKKETPKADPPKTEIADKTEKPSKNGEKLPKNPDTRNPKSEIPSRLPDLTIDSAWVVKRGKKTVTVALIIKNKGEATARLGGKSPKKSEDNLAVNVYFSSTKKLSRGAMLADGIFIDERAGNGLLLPTERFAIEMEVPLDAQTKFTSFLILELDPFQTIEESDKTNNTRAVLSEKIQ